MLIREARERPAKRAPTEEESSSLGEEELAMARRPHAH